MAVDPAVLELARSFVLRKFTEAAGAGSPEAQMVILDEIAALILGDVRYGVVLAEFAQATKEELEAQKTAMAVEKRQHDQRLRIAIATTDAALKVLVPPIRAVRRSKK